MKFNGLWIEKTNYSGYTIHQIDYCNKIEELDIRSYSHLDNDSWKQTIAKEFQSIRRKIS